MDNCIRNTYPEFVKEWDFKKNGSYTPDNVTYGSDKKIWWKCSKGHSYIARVGNRVFGKTGCPYCSHNKVLVGYNDLQTINPELAKQWHPTKNEGILPIDVLPCGKYKYWWQCKKGHSWQARLYDRSNGSGCPYCSNKKILPGFNDLETINLKLAQEWHKEKNKDLKPSQVSVGSNKKVWWKCKNGHEWQAIISSRALGNSGCAICHNVKIVSKENDIMTFHPELLQLWDFNKNKNINPYSLAKTSSYRAWWKCENNHSFLKSISSMTRNSECPICRNNRVKLEGRQKSRTSDKYRKEQIRKRSIAIVNPDLLKEWDFEQNKGLNPEIVSASSNEKVWWKCSKDHHWQARVNSRNKGSQCHICTKFKIYKGYTDLLTTRPEMKEQWDFIKNKDISIYTVSEKSHTRVWWKCENGHSWKESVGSRCKNRFCSYCYNTHGTSFPEQAVFYYIKKVFPKSINRYKVDGEYEVDIYIPELDIGIEYDGVYYHSGEKAKKKEIQKEKKFEQRGIFLIRIKESRKSEGQEILENKKVLYYKIKNNTALSRVIQKLFVILEIENVLIDVDKDMYKIIDNYNIILQEKSVKALMPQKAKEWNIEKNKPLMPDKLAAKSEKKVWWKCNLGHEWKTSPNKRYMENTNCPYCANKKVLAGYNDLQTINPKLAKEWHPTKNGDLKPTQFTFCSGKKVWWICDANHEWRDSIAHRKFNRGCKICKKRTLIKGINDMLSFRKELLEEWDFKKNIGLQPEEMYKASEKKVWWICKKGHRWNARISDRVRGNNCPVCSHQKILKGYNDVQTLKPELATIWHPTKNGNKQLSDFSKCSEEKVWWLCKNGHEFMSTIYSRYSAKHLCKYCYKEKI